MLLDNAVTAIETIADKLANSGLFKSLGLLFTGVSGSIDEGLSGGGIFGFLMELLNTLANMFQGVNLDGILGALLNVVNAFVGMFDGTKESLEKNWCDKKGEPTLWKLGNEGDFYCVPGWKNGGDIYTRGKFGDCQLHLEYRHEADITDLGQGPQMRGNSGVFIMGNYEVQVLESYYTRKDDCQVDRWPGGRRVCRESADGQPAAQAG